MTNATVLKLTLAKPIDSNLRKQVLIGNIQKSFIEIYPKLKPVFGSQKYEMYPAYS